MHRLAGDVWPDGQALVLVRFFLRMGRRLARPFGIQEL